MHSRLFMCRLTTSAGRPRCFASTLVLAEQLEGGKLAPVTLNTLTAAAQLKQDIDCVIFGSEKTNETAEQLKKYGNIKRVLLAEHAAFKGLLAESVTPVLVDLQKKQNYTHILAGASTFSKGVLPRLAALLDVQPISDITKIIDANQFLRFIYAGNAILKLKSNDLIKIATVRGTAFEAAKEGAGSADAKVEKLESLDTLAKNDKSEFVSREVQKSERPELPSARIVSLYSSENSFTTITFA